MVFQYKRAKSYRSYFAVLIIVIIVLSTLLVIGTFLGSLSANATIVAEHPILRKLRIDANTTVTVFDGSGFVNRTKCEIYPLEVKLVEKITDIPQSTDGTATTELIEISDVEGKIQFIYQYPNGTQYGIGEDKNYEDSIWVTDFTKWLENAGVYKWRFLDYSKTFKLASSGQLLDDLVSEGTIEVFSILWLILILDIIITSIFGLCIARINPYGRIGVSFNLWFFKRLNGRLGRWLNALKLFDYQANDQWFVERHLIYKLDFSNSRSIIRELLIGRWRDVWFLPTAIVIFLMTSFEQFLIDFILSLSGEKQYEAFHFIIILFILSIAVSLLLATYYPAVWTYTDIGLKKYRISSTGDVENVQSLGQAIRERVEILFGFTTILSLGSLSMEIINPEGIPKSVQTSTTLLTIAEVMIKFTSMVAFFLMIVCFVAPIVIVVGLVHFSRNHVKVMTETRRQLVILFDTLVGTIQPNIAFAGTDDAIHVYIDDKEEEIHYRDQ